MNKTLFKYVPGKESDVLDKTTSKLSEGAKPVKGSMAVRTQAGLFRALRRNESVQVPVSSQRYVPKKQVPIGAQRYVPNKTTQVLPDPKKDEPKNETTTPKMDDLLDLLPALRGIRESGQRKEDMWNAAVAMLRPLAHENAAKIANTCSDAALREIASSPERARAYVDSYQALAASTTSTRMPMLHPIFVASPSVSGRIEPPPIPANLTSLLPASATSTTPIVQTPLPPPPKATPPKEEERAPSPPLRMRKQKLANQTMHRVTISRLKPQKIQNDEPVSVQTEMPLTNSPSTLSPVDRNVLRRTRQWESKRKCFEVEDAKFKEVNADEFKAMNLKERESYVRWKEDQTKADRENLMMSTFDQSVAIPPSEVIQVGNVKEIADYPFNPRQNKLDRIAEEKKFLERNRSVIVRGKFDPADPPCYGERSERVDFTEGMRFIRRVHLTLTETFGEYYLSTFLLIAILVGLLCLTAYSSLVWRFKVPYAILANVAIYALVFAQSQGHYVVPEAWTDKLYFARMVFIVAHISHLIGQIFVPWWCYYPIRYLEFWYLTDPIIALCFVLHFAFMRGWGIISLFFYFTFVIGVGNTVIVRKVQFLRGAYLAKLIQFGSSSEVHPLAMEARAMVEEAKHRAKKVSAISFLEGLRDPFVVSSIDDIIPVEKGWDFKTDLRPARMRKAIPFSEVSYKRPHFDQVLTDDGTRKYETMVVCREIVSEASRLCFLKFQDKCTGESSGSLLASMMTVLNDINMPFDNSLYYNSVMHGFRLYMLTLQSRKTADQWLKMQSIVTGLSNGSFGKMRSRWFERNFNLPFESSYYNRLSAFVMSECGIVLMPFFGYIWRYIPDQLKEKKFSLDPPRLRLEFLDDLKRAISGYSLLAYAMPTPDIKNADNLIAGVEARLNVGRGKTNVVVGKASHAALKQLMETVRDDIERWQPLNVIPTRDEWLSQVNTYSTAKKKLLSMLDDTNHYVDTMFIKWESYTGFKAPRIISNSDKHFLVVEGPIVKAMEPQLEALPSTLTGLPVSQWSQAVLERVGIYENNPSYKIFVSDISSFESAITPQIKDATENLVFDRVLANYPMLAKKLRQRQQTRHYEKVIRDYRIAYDYTGRASGDARTYCGNTIVNHYLLKNMYRAFKVTELPYFVSGDDSIFVMPSSIDQDQIVNYYNSLGFDVKLKETAVRNSSFCGFNFDPQTYGRMADDPLSVMIKFFTSQENLTMNHYKSYLQDQALCLLHEYPADPVLRKGIDWIVRNKPATSPKKRTWWQREVMKEGNQWYSLLHVQPTDFQTYAENHYEGNFSAQHYAALADLFYDSIRDLYDGRYLRARYRFQCALEKIDVGSARAHFNLIQKTDPYQDEFCQDIGDFYYDHLALFDMAATGVTPELQ